MPSQPIRPTLPMLAALLLAGNAARAHDIWVTSATAARKLEVEVKYGDTDQRELPVRARITTLELLTPTGRQDLRADLATGEQAGLPILRTTTSAAPAGSLIAIVYDNGYWLTAPGDQRETNSSTLLVPKGTHAHWTVKYGKLILDRTSWNRPLHARIELVPLRDPWSITVGQVLPVRLEVEGKPVPGVKVHYADGIEPLGDDRTPHVLSDAEGVALVPFDHKGAWLITADPTVPGAHPALAAEDHLYVSLAFDTSR